VAEFMQESIVFLVRVQCRRKESSRSLSHLLMSFLYITVSQLIILNVGFFTALSANTRVMFLSFFLC